MDKKKILIITNACTMGGAEAHLLSLVQNLNKEKYQITFSYFKERPDEAVSLKKDFEETKVNVIDLNIENKFSLCSVFKIRKIIKKIDPDIVHTNLFQSEVLIRIALLFFKSAPIFITTWHNMEEFLENKFWAKIVRFNLNRADAVITISDAVADYLSEKTGYNRKKIKRIYYGLSIDDRPLYEGQIFADDIRKKHNIKDSELIVGMVARYAPQKGHGFLIEALSEILKEVPNVKLYFAGHDEKGIKESLEDYAEQIGVAKNIIFDDFNPDPVSLMSQFDIFALSSLWEGFGLVLLEAMSVGKPIIATNVGPIPEIIRDGKDGFLVPPKDSKKLAEKIILLLKDKNLREKMGEAGKERLKDFSIERMVKETESVYDDLLKKYE